MLPNSDLASRMSEESVAAARKYLAIHHDLALKHHRPVRGGWGMQASDDAPSGTYGFRSHALRGRCGQNGPVV